jgi:hypothetical protein
VEDEFEGAVVVVVPLMIPLGGTVIVVGDGVGDEDVLRKTNPAF